MTVTVMGKADMLPFPQSAHPTSGKTIQCLQALLDALGTTIYTEFRASKAALTQTQNADPTPSWWHRPSAPYL